MNVLITGGTGSLGQALTRELLALRHTHYFEKIIIFSRDEWKQAQMASELNDKRVQFFLGDVRDHHRLCHAFRGVHVVIHAAALKRVDAVAYNPTEVISTNIIGTQNVCDAAIDAKVPKVIVVSSDKACEPSNIYGKSKAIAEELAVAYNVFGFPQGTKSSCVRYGNVLTSRGAAYHLFKALGEQKLPIPITNPHMTRFGISMNQAVQFIICVLYNMRGGEIYVPRLPTFRITDLAKVMAPDSPIEVVGKRPGGEKLHEAMISRHETDRTQYYENMGWYIIHPSKSDWGYQPAYGGSDPVFQDKVEGELYNGHGSYTSEFNMEWLTADQLEVLLTTGLCPSNERKWM